MPGVGVGCNGTDVTVGVGDTRADTANGVGVRERVAAGVGEGGIGDVVVVAVFVARRVGVGQPLGGVGRTRVAVGVGGAAGVVGTPRRRRWPSTWMARASLRERSATITSTTAPRLLCWAPT
jgi:hypothetical protein